MEVLQLLHDIKELLTKQTIENKELFSMEEAALFTGLSTSTLYKLTADRKINFFKPNGKVIFFKKQDIVDYITSNVYETKVQLTNKISLR